ncbi:hypothetical protein GXM_06227 [Nostoc sphaeroides CCNUC1]|uniref:Uncharacterized protein n=1 Tax=Nostoc sphaeroides CCNUC1 TaxID=2653204 RepID=A0A5P8W7H4_9NOSO|nr:hypothetical protein GXM_06227 [Nostoc sphaeroides CCNUC1]
MCTDNSGRTEQFGRNFPSKGDVYDGLRLRTLIIVLISLLESGLQ